MIESPAEDVKQRIVEYLYLKGAGVDELAQMLEIAPKEVRQRITANGIHIRALYLKGHSKRAIARILGLSYYEVNKQLGAAGLG